MRKIGMKLGVKLGVTLAVSVFMAGSALAAGSKTKVKISMDDIASIVETNAQSGVMMVRTYDGRKLRLKLSAQQIEVIQKKFQGVNTGNKISITSAASSTAPAATTTAKAADVKEEKTSPWGFLWVMSVNSGVEKLHDGEGSIQIYQIPILSYKLKNGIKLGFVPGFYHDYDLTSSIADNKLLDWQVTVAKGGYKLPLDIGMSLKGRYYLPTGLTTIKNEGLGKARLDVNLSKKINSTFNLSYSASPRYSFNTKASTFDVDDFGRISGNAKSTTGFQYIHTLGLSETLSESFSLSQSLQLSHTFKNADEEVGASGDGSTGMSLGLGLDYSAADWLALTFAIGQDFNLSSEEPISFLETADMTYTVDFVFIF